LKKKGKWSNINPSLNKEYIHELLHK